MNQTPRAVADEALIDAIYEAAVVPELWRDVIARMCGATDAALGSLFTFSEHGVIRWIGTPEADALIGAFASLNKPELNTRISRGGRLLNDGFLTDADIFSPEEIDVEPFYRDFLHPLGYGWVAATAFDVPSGDKLIFSLERKRQRGNFERSFVDALNCVRPHLGRAGLVAARLGLERARAMAQALEIIGLPAAVLRMDGAVHAANPSLVRLIPDVAQDRRERLVLTDRTADGLFARALAASRQPASGQVQSIPVAAQEEHPPMVVHVLPIKGAAHDIFSQSGSIVVVTPVDRAAVVTAEVLQGLFDLTPAEARAARAVAEGRSVGEIASAGGVSEETIRSHVKAVLAKTGLNRQAELVALLAGTSLPAAGSK